MAAVVAHLTAAAAAGGPPAAADLGSAADALSRAYDLGAEPPAAADAPSFLTVWEAGTTALGVAPAAATSAGGSTRSVGGAAAAAPVTSAPTFEKFLRTLKKTKFFEGVAEGSPEYDARVATARAKFDSKYGAGASAGVAAGVVAGAAAGVAAGAAAGVAAGVATAAPTTDAPDEASAVRDANGGAAPTDADIAAAEELKAQGNDALLRKDYPEAERLYTAALARRPGTAVYLSNRAAAKIYQASFVDALDDCKAAIEAEPGFVRAHERLASAYRHLGMVDEEVAALQDAAALDPASTKIASALASAVARSTGEGPAGNSSVGSRGAPSPSAGGGGGGAGGVGGGLRPGMPPGLEGLLNNPAVRSMAENFASSGGLQSMMNNPAAMANMMGALGGMGGAGGAGGGGGAPRGGAPRGPGAGGGDAGGGMPDLSALLSNPALASMMGNLGGAGGAPGGGGAGGGAPPNPMAAIQQAMSDPEQMAQLMNMAQGFLGGGRGGGAGGAPPQ